MQLHEDSVLTLYVPACYSKCNKKRDRDLQIDSDFVNEI